MESEKILLILLLVFFTEISLKSNENNFNYNHWHKVAQAYQHNLIYTSTSNLLIV